MATTEVPDTDWRNLALRLMAELSWCVGFVEQVGECVPSTTRAVLDDALARLTERAEGERRE